jgi:hypothetical protein
MSQFRRALNPWNTATIFLAIIAGMPAWVGSTSAAVRVDAIGKELSLYASFDASAQPEFTRGASTVKGEYHATRGIAGQAIDIQSSPISYLESGNLIRKAGTLSFWVNPSLDMASQTGRGPATRDIFAAVNFLLRAYPNQPGTPPVIFFMTGATLPGKDYAWDYGTKVPIESFPAGKWTNVALIWDHATGRKKVYVNGKQVAEQASPLMESDDFADLLTLGAGLPGSYDELALWGRVLTPAEIHLLATKPLDVARALAETARIHARETVQWTIYPELVYQNYADSLVEPNESLSLQLPLKNLTDGEQSAMINVEVQDIWERTVGKAQTFHVKLTAGETLNLPFTVSADKFGAYRVAVTVDVGGGKLSRDVTTFGCLPENPPPSHPFFGGHINQGGTIPQMGRRLGFSANRVHNMTQFTWWFRMEPQRGDWAMDLSEYYQRGIDLGYAHYGQWMYAPYWAVTFKNGTHPADPGNVTVGTGWAPTDVDALRAYIRESLIRFPAIKEWEIWNEPYVPMFWDGTAGDYVRLCQIVYTEAKKTRPDMTIYSQLNYEGQWTDEAIRLGVLNYCDGVSYHFYQKPNNDPQAAAGPVKKLRALLAREGKPEMPIVDSEGGMDSTTFLRGLDFPDLPPREVRPAMNFRQSAQELVQAHVVMIAAGVRGWYYYFLQPVAPADSGLWKYINYSALEVTRSPKPNVIARAELIWQLDGGHFAAELKPAAIGLRAYAFERQDGHAVAVLWTERDARVELVVPSGFKVVDLMGNPIENPTVEIDQSPLYLHAPNIERLRLSLSDPSVVKAIRPPAKTTAPQNDAAAPGGRLHDFPIAAELGTDNLVPLDLSGVANATLTDKVDDGDNDQMNEDSRNAFAGVSPGRHMWFGVPFAISQKAADGRNVLTLEGGARSNGSKDAGPIDAGDHRLRGLFFAHATDGSQDGAAIAEYVVHYEDGRNITLPIIVGRNIGNWWLEGTDGEDARTVGCKVDDPAYPYRFVRIWYWENTRPRSNVESISVRSHGGGPAMMTLAITAALQPPITLPASRQSARIPRIGDDGSN